MRCQNCDQNEATIHLYANVGGHRKQIDYCQNCYQKMKNQMSNTVNNGPKDPFGFNNLDELFKQLSQQMQQANNQEPQTPPTQSVVEITSLTEAIVQIIRNKEDC